MTRAATQSSIPAVALATGCMAMFASGSARAQSLVGNCEPSVAEAYLDANNVYARIPINGQLFYRSEPHVYRVPRFSSSNAIFATSIVIGGLVDDQVHLAGTRYGPAEFWAGPLDDNGAPPSDCSEFDHVFNIDRRDLEAFERDGSASSDLSNWPTGLGAPTLDASGKRIDVSGLSYEQRLARTIDLAAGERPELVGNQALWWIVNDRGNVHASTDSPTIGIELHGYAYAVASGARSLNDATFYRFKVVNRGTNELRRAYFGIFVDPDLGDAGDDYVGSDTLRHLGFVYNSDDDDVSGEGYGRAPPSVGFRILKGLLADDDGVDNDRDGTIDEPEERMGMSHFMYYNNGGGPNEDPLTRNDYYNYFRGLWKNGNPALVGGDGFESNVTSEPANYMYPGDPVAGEYWSEVNVDGAGSMNTPADRRFILSSGPFDLLPGQAKEVDFTVVYGRGTDNIDSINEMRHASDALQAVFDAGFSFYPPAPQFEGTVQLVSPPSGVTGLPGRVLLEWDPLAGAQGYTVSIFSAESSRSFAYSTESASINAIGLEPNTVYQWRVRGVSEFGAGSWSEQRIFETGDPDSSQYVAVTPYNTAMLKAGHVVFRWAGADANVRLQIAYSENFADPIYDRTTSAGFAFPTVPYKRYFWRISPEEGIWSPTWTFSTLEIPGTAKNDDPIVEFRAFPNPASTTTTVQYYLREAGNVTLTLSDALGRRVATLQDRFLVEGMQFVTVPVDDYPTGMYFCTLTVGGFSMTRVMVVAK